MLNSLANHGFLQRSGKNITIQNIIDALFQGLNMDQALAEFLSQFALTTNPLPNATWFSLDHLSRHNILEHDASLRYLTNHLLVSPSLERCVLEIIMHVKRNFKKK
jgi:hypothetical protein